MSESKRTENKDGMQLVEQTKKLNMGGVSPLFFSTKNIK